MDFGCVCICSTNYDEADVFHSKIVKARKKHTCCECKEDIKPGELYEYVSGCWEGYWNHYKTCKICVRIRSEICCGGWVFGELRETIWEAYGLDYVTGHTWDDDD